jgi:hypothetical protein
MKMTLDTVTYLTHLYMGTAVLCFFVWNSSALGDASSTWATRQPVSLGSQTYLVAVDPAKTYALVGPLRRSTKMTVKTVERAAKTVTGCAPTVERVVSMWTGGRDDNAIPMSNLEDIPAVRVDLKC